MKVRIIAVGKLKERFWKDAIEEYKKRLSAYTNIEIVEVPDRDPEKTGGDQKAMQAEGIDIIRAMGHSYGIAMAIEGKQRSSEQLSKHLNDLMVSGQSEIAFIIGGSTGLSDEVKKVAKEQLSFGPITMPHNLARVVLLEQIYRSFKIMRNEPYHK